MSSTSDDFGDLSSALGEAIKEEQQTVATQSVPKVKESDNNSSSTESQNYLIDDNPYVGLTFEDDSMPVRETQRPATPNSNFKDEENMGLQLNPESNEASNLSNHPSSATPTEALLFESDTPQYDQSLNPVPTSSGGAFGKSQSPIPHSLEAAPATVQSPFMQGVKVNLDKQKLGSSYEQVEFDSKNAIIGGLIFSTIGSALWCLLFCVTLGFFSILTRMLIAYFAVKGTKWGFKNGFTPEARNIAIGTCIFGLLLGNFLVSFTSVTLIDKLATVALEEMEENPEAYQTEHEDYQDYDSSDYDIDDYIDSDYNEEEYDVEDAQAEYDELRSEFTIMSVFKEMTVDFRFLISVFIACSFAANKVSEDN